MLNNCIINPKGFFKGYKRITIGFVQSLGELMNAWGDLDSLLQDGLLALKADISGPLNVTGQVTSGLNITTNRKVTRSGREEMSMSGMPIFLLASGLGNGTPAKGRLFLSYSFLLSPIIAKKRNIYC